MPRMTEPDPGNIEERNNGSNRKRKQRQERRQYKRHRSGAHSPVGASQGYSNAGEDELRMDEDKHISYELWEQLQQSVNVRMSNVEAAETRVKRDRRDFLQQVASRTEEMDRRATALQQRESELSDLKEQLVAQERDARNAMDLFEARLKAGEALLHAAYLSVSKLAQSAPSHPPADATASASAQQTGAPAPTTSTPHAHAAAGRLPPQQNGVPQGHDRVPNARAPGQGSVPQDCPPAPAPTSGAPHMPAGARSTQQQTQENSPVQANTSAAEAPASASMQSNRPSASAATNGPHGPHMNATPQPPAATNGPCGPHVKAVPQPPVAPGRRRIVFKGQHAPCPEHADIVVESPSDLCADSSTRLKPPHNPAGGDGAGPEAAGVGAETLGGGSLNLGRNGVPGGLGAGAELSGGRSIKIGRGEEFKGRGQPMGGGSEKIGRGKGPGAHGAREVPLGPTSVGTSDGFIPLRPGNGFIPLQPGAGFTPLQPGAGFIPLQRPDGHVTAKPGDAHGHMPRNPGNPDSHMTANPAPAQNPVDAQHPDPSQPADACTNPSGLPHAGAETLPSKGTGSSILPDVQSAAASSQPGAQSANATCEPGVQSASATCPPSCQARDRKDGSDNAQAEAAQATGPSRGGEDRQVGTQGEPTAGLQNGQAGAQADKGGQQSAGGAGKGNQQAGTGADKGGQQNTGGAGKGNQQIGDGKGHQQAGAGQESGAPTSKGGGEAGGQSGQARSGDGKRGHASGRYIIQGRYGAGKPGQTSGGNTGQAGNGNGKGGNTSGGHGGTAGTGDEKPGQAAGLGRDKAGRGAGKRAVPVEWGSRAEVSTSDKGADVVLRQRANRFGPIPSRSPQGAETQRPGPFSPARTPAQDRPWAPPFLSPPSVNPFAAAPSPQGPPSPTGCYSGGRSSKFTSPPFHGGRGRSGMRGRADGGRAERGGRRVFVETAAPPSSGGLLDAAINRLAASTAAAASAAVSPGPVTSPEGVASPPNGREAPRSRGGARQRGQATPRRSRAETQAAAESVLQADAPGLLQLLKDEKVLDSVFLLPHVGIAIGSDDEGDATDGEAGPPSSMPPSLLSAAQSILSKACVAQGLHAETGKKLSSRSDDSAEAHKGGGYTVDALQFLVDQAEGRSAPGRAPRATWGWCRELQSFIFVFEQSNLIVVEKPEYGHATYFFGMEEPMPVADQVRRLVAVLSVRGMGRSNLLENSKLVFPHNLSAAEVLTLRQCGWEEGQGIPSLLNFNGDRIFHVRSKSGENIQEAYKQRISKILNQGGAAGRVFKPMFNPEVPPAAAAAAAAADNAADT